MQKTLVLALTMFSLSAHAQFNGVPFSDDVARCQYASDQISAEQQAVIEANMGQHAHRLYHWLWHSTRNGWASLTFDQQSLVSQLSPEWGRHQPLCPSPDQWNQNASGEEFLRMHHQMIDFMREQLVANRQACINGWTQIPQSSDPSWPVPPGDERDSSKSAQMDRLLQIWSQTFMDPNYLRAHTLSEIGFLLEFSAHNNLHMRYANLPRAGDDFSPFTNGTTVNSLMQPSGFDGPAFNYLGNPYSAAVSPIFWKIHGWVDNVVVAWLAANQYLRISDNCQGDITCYQWRSGWIGGMGYQRVPQEPVGGSGHHNHGDMSMGAPGDDTDIASPLATLMGQASFRNKAFDDFVSEPRGGAGEEFGTTDSSPFDDPAEFVRSFGPCR